MKKICAFKVAIFTILAGSLALAAAAQVPTSTINGIVTDPHQAVIDGYLKAKNEAFEEARQAQTHISTDLRARLDQSREHLARRP